MWYRQLRAHRQCKRVVMHTSVIHRTARDQELSIMLGWLWMCLAFLGKMCGVGGEKASGVLNICVELEETKPSWMGCGCLGLVPAQQTMWASGTRGLAPI